VAQSVKPARLDFGSGHDPRVVRSRHMSGSMMGVKPASDSSLPPPLPLSPLVLTLSHSFFPSKKKTKQNTHTHKNNKETNKKWKTKNIHCKTFKK